MDYINIKPETAAKFSSGICEGFGMTKDNSSILADILVESDLTGVETHGIARLSQYFERIKSGVLSPNLNLEIIRDLPWAVVVDTHEAMGHIASYKTMEMVIQKAKTLGIGVGLVKGSTHFGMASYYARMAAQQDMIGVSITNTAPTMAPFGGMEAMIGNNPIAVAAPTRSEPISLDFACSQVARGKILKLHREGQNQIPSGWALDSDGQPTTDAAKALVGVILPFGAHKGYGLAFIADIMTGALAGGNLSSEAPNVDDYSRPRDTCHFFMAINIAMLRDIDEYKDSVDRYIKKLKSTKTAAGFDEIKFPGEIEMTLRRKRIEEGIPYHISTLKILNKIAEELGVEAIEL